MNTPIYSAEEIKAKLSLSDSDMQKMIDSGEVKTITFNGKVFYTGNFSRFVVVSDQDMIEKKWVTVHEAGILTGRSDATIRRAIDRGEVSSSFYGFKTVIETSSLEAYIRNKEKETIEQKQRAELKKQRRKDNIARYKARKAYWARYGETINPEDFNTNF